MISVGFVNLKQIDNIQIYYPFNKYLLSSYYEPGSVLGPVDIAKNKTKTLAPWK